MRVTALRRGGHGSARVGSPAGATEPSSPSSVRRHSRIGHAILAETGSELLELDAEIALTHHKWFDGRGYPDALEGDEIPPVPACRSSFLMPQSLSSHRGVGGFLASLASALALASPPAAAAYGGHYVFTGGGPEARGTVRAALEASAFDFSLVPVEVTIRITSCGCAGARPGLIVLDEAALVDGSKRSWGIVQHEYAHQVDAFLLTNRQRVALAARLGGADWCYESPGLGHDDHACERFADVFAWAFWPSSENVLAAEGREHAAGIRARQFRGLLRRMIAGREGQGLERSLRYRADTASTGS